MIRIIELSSEALLIINSKISWIALGLIDKERMHHAQEACEQEDEISELNLLMSMQEVKTDAVKSKGWNEDHQECLQFLVNTLMAEHDWEFENVERYLDELMNADPIVGK